MNAFIIVPKYNMSELPVDETNIIFYYRLISSPYKIESTKSIDDFILLLYNGTGEFITDVQRSELKLSKDYIQKIKLRISSNKTRVPLYDISSNHIFLIQDINVYPRILDDSYRFIDKSFYADLVELSDPTEATKENLRILSNYDLDQLQQTYFRIFYDSFVFNEYITACRRPSFKAGMSHIRPYYRIDELYYLALDWNLIESSKLKKFKEMDLRNLCKKISTYDIPGEILLDHQSYISKTNSIGLVKNYSLFGSYFINQYLRKYGCCLEKYTIPKESVIIKNSVLENQIKLMIKLIASAPKFTRAHTVYRFIESDHYLLHLKPGDLYTDPSFMSTTRNPFSYQENYNFGYILIKIRIPADKIGIGLCIESYSNFPSEEEIILPPTSIYKLISVGDQPDTQHHIADKKLPLNKIKKRYEFELVTNNFIEKDFSKIKLNMLPIESEPKIPDLDFDTLLTDENIKFTPVASRLKYFARYYVNANSQFKSKIGKLDITFTLQSYDSSSVYKPFFYNETQFGLMMYSFNPFYGNINVIIELGLEIHINYYFKYSITDTSLQLKLSDPNWIRWLSLLSYIVGSKCVVIHSNYSMFSKKEQTRYAHSDDIYNYLTKKELRFGNFDNDIIMPNFDYAQLDYLHLVNLFDDNILSQTDRDELYKLATDSKIKTIAEFYIYIVDTRPDLSSLLEEKINLFYERRSIAMNLPKSISYTLNSWTYLLNHNLVNLRPKDNDFNIRSGTFKSLIGDKKIPQFKNRLRYYFLNK